ncbi:MAG: phosphoesterase [Flavobacteriaceae bacterium]|nr:MAG: phosphoesterase [Flavobacteriaceae bacterium]
MLTRLLVLLFVCVLIEIYCFKAVKTAYPQFLGVYLGFTFCLYVFFLYKIFTFSPYLGLGKTTLFTSVLFLLFVLPKLLVFGVLFVEDLGRTVQFSWQKIQSFFQKEQSSISGGIPRSVFLSKLALFLTTVPFLSVLYGITKGKYKYRVIKKAIDFPELPKAFDGLRILHISDIHVGSFNQVEPVKKAIELINAQEFDLFVFTGDLVNNLSSEMSSKWVELFKTIKTPKYGKFSILGNHDYGEYIQFHSAQEKQRNFEEIKALHPKINFNLLLNDSVLIEKDSERIHLIGVENWGEHFKKLGNLTKASEKVDPKAFKILLSHDPSHWEKQVQNNEVDYHLTLSGHTHGMQFGIEIPGFITWSPVKYVYRFWAGLYKSSNRYLYVNRGFGFHGFPGRVGIWPEITLLEIRSKTTS